MGSLERAFSVLIVEDQALIALHIEDVVRRIGGGSIGSAAQISDALTLIETTPWDTALLDLRLALGEMAYPVADRLRAKGIPFAFVTGWDGEIDTPYSDVPVLRKPFGETEVESCLRMLLAKTPQPTIKQATAA